MPINSPQLPTETPVDSFQQLQLARARYLDRLYMAFARRPFLNADDVLKLITWERPEWCSWRGIGCHDESSATRARRLLYDAEFGTFPVPCTPRELQKWAAKLGVSLPTAFTENLKHTAMCKPRKRRIQIDENKAECRRLAQELWAENSSLTLDGVADHPKLASYRRAYRGKETIPGWIRDLNPNKGRRGRRKRQEAGRRIQLMK